MEIFIIFCLLSVAFTGKNMRFLLLFYPLCCPCVLYNLAFQSFLRLGLKRGQYAEITSYNNVLVFDELWIRWNNTFVVSNALPFLNWIYWNEVYNWRAGPNVLRGNTSEAVCFIGPLCRLSFFRSCCEQWPWAYFEKGKKEQKQTFNQNKFESKAE